MADKQDIAELLEQCDLSDETGYVMKEARKEILRLRAEIIKLQEIIDTYDVE